MSVGLLRNKRTVATASPTTAPRIRGNAARWAKVIVLALCSCNSDVPPVGGLLGHEATHPVARREEYGGLIVLHLYGSYREMGKQAADLLGESARRAERLYRQRWQELVEDLGTRGRLAGAFWPSLWSWAGWRYEQSGFFLELDGVSKGLNMTRADAVRGFYGGIFGGGSTAFVATGRASGGRGAVLGRNVDWSDDDGIRRPVVAYYQPTNGDLSFVTVGWVLSMLPIVGLNEAGLAISLNFFEADRLIAYGMPQIVYRRVLQLARSVDEANAMLLEDGNHGGSAFVMLADAEGNIGVLECLPRRCARYDTGQEWIGLSNHARTESMVPHDRGRTPDSVRRLHAIETAVQRHLGGIGPETAAQILRDRSNSPYANDSTVANLRVLNSVVAQPGAGTVWHSTTVQPHAPFGEMVPFSIEAVRERPASLAADTRLGEGGLERERELVGHMRAAAALFDAGRVEEACAIWDRIAVASESSVEPYRLLWARGRARWTLRRWGEAESLLAQLDEEGAPVEVRAYGLVALGMVRDRMGKREEALAAYGRAETYLREHGEHASTGLFAPLYRWIEEGRWQGQRGEMPKTPDLQSIPH